MSNSPTNPPFVAERVNGKVQNFPYGGYIHYFPNRKLRRAAMKTVKPVKKENIQQIYILDKIRNKFKLLKTLFHFKQD